jgi:hypothetical protein
MRDDFDEKTKEILARRAGFRCSNPKCRKLTTGPQANPARTINIGVAAHVAAASPGGKRYDPNQTPEERKSISNGIWLCQSCAKLIDSDDVRYTVDLLQEWKSQSEAMALREIEETDRHQIEANTDPLDILSALLETPNEWVGVQGDEYIRHRYHTQFVIKRGQTINEDYIEPWTKRFPDTSAWSYHVEYWQGSTLLKRSCFVVVDGGRYTVPLPKLRNRDPMKDGWDNVEFSIDTNSIEWKTAKLFDQYAPLEEVLPRVGVDLVV